MLQRNETETYVQFMKRVIAAVKNGTIEYPEMGDLLLEERNCYSGDNLRKAFYVLDKICDNIDDDSSFSSDELCDELERRKFEVLKERKKLQVLNSQYNNNARKEGRFELYLENIADAIKNTKPLNIPQTRCEYPAGDGIGCLVIADAHYGRDVEIRGLNNEIINKYNPEEFERRMWNLLSQLESDRIYPMYKKLVVIDCGDSIEGILRNGSSLVGLKYGVVDSIAQYATFIGKWLCAAALKLGVSIEYSLAGGNHDILRLLESKPVFEDESAGKLITKIAALVVENETLKKMADGISFSVEVKPYSNVIYNNFFGQTVLAYHGESSNMEDDIRFFENFYGVEIDILIGAHLHHGESKDIGFGFFGNKEIIRVPALCGIDKYSVKIKKSARAGAKFINFTSNGKGFEKTYFLN